VLDQLRAAVDEVDERDLSERGAPELDRARGRARDLEHGENPLSRADAEDVVLRDRRHEARAEERRVAADAGRADPAQIAEVDLASPGNEAAVGGPVAAYLDDAGAPIDRTTALDGHVAYVSYGATLDFDGSTDDEIGAGEVDDAAAQTGGGADGNDEVSFGLSCDDADEQCGSACD